MAVEGLRDRRRRELMDEIHRVALELAVRNGYTATSIQDIADAAHVSLRTVFRHFASKDAIFGHGVERREAQILARMKSRPIEEPLLDSYLHAIAELVADARSAEQEFFVLNEVPALRAQYLVPSVHHNLDPMDGEFARRLGCDPGSGRLRLLRYCLVNAVAQAFSDWKADGYRGDLPDSVTDYVDMFRPMVGLFNGPSASLPS